MDFSAMNDKAVLAELGVRIKSRRLAMNITQAELMRKAGVARKVVQNMESGRSSTTKGFIRVLRALGLIEMIGQLFPEPGPSPLVLAELKGKERLRASGHRESRRSNGSAS
jgi:transcriptional regulator with XRE-family HTH domain